MAKGKVSVKLASGRIIDGEAYGPGYGKDVVSVSEVLARDLVRSGKAVLVDGGPRATNPGEVENRDPAPKSRRRKSS